MPTQEERLTALEQSSASFQKEAARHIRETEENTTILLGVIRSQGQDIKRMVQHLETIDEHLGTIEERWGTIEGRLGTMEGRLGTVEGRLGTMDERLGTIEGHVETMDENYHQLQTILNEHTILLTRILARLA